MPLRSTKRDPNLPLPKWTQPTPDADVGSFDVSGGVEAAAKAGAPLISSLISIYKDPAARANAVREFKASVEQFLHRNAIPAMAERSWREAAETAAERYPRVVAHVRQDPTLLAHTDRSDGLISAASVNSPKTKGVSEPLKLNLYQPGVDEIARDPNKAKDTLFHELTHVAQSLGNKDADELYYLSSSLTPYRYIPYESTARMAGARARYDIPRPTAKNLADPINDLKWQFQQWMAHPQVAGTESAQELNYAYKIAEATGNWDHLRRVMMVRPPNRFPGVNPVLRGISERGLLLDPASPQHRAALRMSQIMGAREAKPLAPTQAELAAMNPLQRAAQKLKWW